MCNSHYLSKAHAEICARSDRIGEVVDRIQKHPHIAQEDIISKLKDFAREINECHECGQLDRHESIWNDDNPYQLSNFKRKRATMALLDYREGDGDSELVEEALHDLIPKRLKDIESLSKYEREFMLKRFTERL